MRSSVAARIRYDEKVIFEMESTVKATPPL